MAELFVVDAAAGEGAQHGGVHVEFLLGHLRLHDVSVQYNGRCDINVQNSLCSLGCEQIAKVLANPPADRLSTGSRKNLARF